MISVITVLVLVLNNYILKVNIIFLEFTFFIALLCNTFVLFCFHLQPWVSRKSIIPVPIELIAVLIGTIVSNYFSLNTENGVKIVGEISVG